jgi:hypothetical protein
LKARGPFAIYKTKDLKVHHKDHKGIKPNRINLDWAKDCYVELNIKVKLEVTHDNLMNLLDLAKSNRADK